MAATTSLSTDPGGPSAEYVASVVAWFGREMSAGGGDVGKVRVGVERLHRLDDRVGLSPESRWDRRGGPRRLERWVLSHPVLHSLGVAAIALIVHLFEMIDPFLLVSVTVSLIVVTWATRRRWHDWQELRRGEHHDGP